MNVRLSDSMIQEKLLTQDKVIVGPLLSDNASAFVCLNGNDVITARISDHHPVVHHNTLFWNIQMKGRAVKDEKENIIGFNNGFGMEESEIEYLERLKKVATVIAEIIHKHPKIEIIGICEGPVDLDHEIAFLKYLKSFPHLKRWGLNKPKDLPNVVNWGLMMLTDKQYKVKRQKYHDAQSLGNRFQIWKIETPTNTKYFALCHFPFPRGEEYKAAQQGYRHLVLKLLDRLAVRNLIIAGDFNFNPHLIHPNIGLADKVPVNNSILFFSEKDDKLAVKQEVTVDAIVLSKSEKQSFIDSVQDINLTGKLLREFNLFRKNVKLVWQRMVSREIEFDPGFKLQFSPA